MIKILHLFIITSLCFNSLACKDDAPTICTNLVNIQSEAKINDEKMLLQLAEIRKNDAPPTLDTYEILIEAIGNDCNQLLKFRFYASVPKDQKLEGEFDVLETNVFTTYYITSLSYTVHTIEPVNFNTLYAVSGTATITAHAANEYSIHLNAELSDTKEIDLNLRHQF